MSWHFLILFQTFFAALHVLVVRRIATKPAAAKASMLITAGINIALYPLGLLMVPFLGEVRFDNVGMYWPWYVFGGLAFAVSNIGVYKALTYLDAAIASILATCSIVFTVVIAHYVLHDYLSPYQWFGSGLLLCAIWYVLAIAKGESTNRHQNNWILGLGFSLLGGLFYGIAIVNEKYLLSRMNISTYLVYGWGFQLIMAISVATIYQRHKIAVFKDKIILRDTFLAGALRAVAGIMFVTALVWSNNVSVITVVSNFKIVLIALLAGMFLNEKRDFAKKLISAGMATVALSIIFWK